MMAWDQEIADAIFEALDNAIVNEYGDDIDKMGAYQLSADLGEQDPKIAAVIEEYGEDELFQYITAWKKARGRKMCLQERFAMFDDEYIKFEDVENKRSMYADLHAFLMLEELAPPKKREPDARGRIYYSDLIAGAGHDEFYLDTDADLLHKNATDDQIRDLVRCGVRFDEDSLKMFA